MAVQVDYRIAPSDQFSVYNPDTKSNKTITYFTLLAKIRGDLNLPSGTAGDITGSGAANYVAKFSSDKNIVNSQIYDTGTHIGIDNTSPTHKLDVNGGIYADYFQLDTSYSDGAVAGKFSWNPDRETAELGLNGTVSLILGQDNLWYVKNQTGTAIPKGRAVMAVGALGASSRILVAPMVADGSISSKYLIGITIEEIANGDDGFVVSQGKLRGFDTSVYTQGTVLYCDPNNAGLLTSTEPTAPDLKLPIAFTVDSKNNGTLAIRVTAGTTISEANDVQLTSPSDNDFLVYNSTSGIFENEAIGIFKTIAVSGQSDVAAESYTDTLTLVAGTNITITTDAATDTITINSPDAGGTVTNIATSAPITGGPITTTGTIGITQSGASTDGYLSSTDWNTFNSKEPALTKGDLTESTSSILTIGNGTGAVIGSGTTITVAQSGSSTDGYLSSTDWNTFNGKEPALTKGNLTETTSAVLTITGGTNAVIGSGTTIEVSQATTTTSGYLSSVDWNTFNDKEPALTKGNLTETTSAILTITGGTNAVIGSGTTIEVSQASSTTSGYLSSADWNTFNDKEPAVTKGNLTEATSAVLTITGGTNAVIGSGTTIEVTQSSTSTSGYLSSTDWNTFNSKEPALTKGNLTETTSAILTITGGANAVIGSGTTISVSQSTTSTDGYLSSTDWNTFNGKQNALTFGNLTETSSSILTITGGTNAVVGSGTTIAVAQASSTVDGFLSSTDWSTFDGKADYSFVNIAVSGQTDVVADAASDTLTLVAGSGVTITTDALTDSITIAATGSGGTVTSIATTAPIQGGPITGTGTISITQSGLSTDGYLSSTDWNTFNGKQDALTFGNLTETTSSILTITGGTGAVVGSGTTIAVTQASASTNGFLSSADWTTFNSKEPAVTKGNLTEATSSVLTITNGTGAVIGSGTSIQVSQSSASTSGYLSSADWTTFNGKASYAFKTISVSGQSDIVADAADDTLTVAEGARIDITTDATNDILTITHGTASGADFTTAQDFKDRVEADGGIFEAIGEVAVALGILEDSLPATASDNSDGVVLQNIAVDEFGHVLGYSSTDLDDRYYTETESDNKYAQNAFKDIAVSGQTTISADSKDDTLTVAAGTGITLATTAASDTLTITNSAPDQTVVLTAGTGISTSGTYPSFTVTNSAPDQVVSLSAGTGISTSGTYPSFTITNSAPDQTVVLTAGTGISISGTYPTFTITNSVSQSNYTNLISAQVGEADSENTTTLNYGILYSLSALGGVGARTRSTPVMDMYHFTNVQYTGASGLQSAAISNDFYTAAIAGNAVPTTTDLVTAEFLYHSQMAAMMMQNHHGQSAKIDLSQVDAMLTIVGSLTLATGVQTRLIVVHFGKDVYPYDESGNSTFTNRRPDVWQYGYSSVVSGTLTEKFFGLTMANDEEDDVDVSIAMSGWGFVLINTEDAFDYTSTATIQNNSLIRIRCREEYYTP